MRMVYSYVSLVLIFAIVYLVGLVVYRLFLSPIARIPGSKLTALTGWYETYFDVVKGGQFVFKIEEWHKRYGPIIRINPTEVHIRDVDFWDTLYASNAPFDKVKKWQYRFGLPESSQSAVKHDLHHRRRVALNPYFSKRQITNFSPYIQERTKRLCDRLNSEFKSASKIVNLNDAWAAFSADIVTYYCLSWSWDFIDYPDFVAPFTASTRELSNAVHVAGHFPWLLSFFQSLPDLLLGLINPAMRPIIDLQNATKEQIIDIMGVNGGVNKDHSQRTVVHTLLSSELPASELSISRLQQEVTSILGAGIETTKSTLVLASFHILKNPQIHQRLRDELQTAFPDLTKPPTLSELEKLPFFNAVIHESLRLSYGVSQRLPRISSRPIQYSTHVIPPGVPVSMTIYLQHHDEIVFPSSRTFDPDRWLVPTEKGKDRPLSRYLVPFSKGTRMCLGFHLAWAELYIGLAGLFRRVDLELFETESDAVEMGRDYFVPRPAKGTQGVRVQVK